MFFQAEKHRIKHLLPGEMKCSALFAPIPLDTWKSEMSMSLYVITEEYD